MSEDVPMPCDVCGGTIYPGDGCCDDCYFAKVMDLRTDYDRGLDDGRGLERAAIVAWIRMNDPDWPVIDIERGEHLRGDDE
jgi:hypothetical protein